MKHRDGLVLPHGAVSARGMLGARTAPQRAAEARLKTDIMLVEVESEAEEAEAFVGAGRQHYQELLHNGLGWESGEGTVVPSALGPVQR